MHKKPEKVTVVCASIYNITFFLKGSITIWLICFIGLDLTKQANLRLIKHKQNG